MGIEKVVPLKVVLALLVVADHLTFHVALPWLAPFRELGSSIVSVFLFLSAFGLAQSFLAKGQSYLDSFFQKRIWRVLVPALLALLSYYVLLWNPARNYWKEFYEMVHFGNPMLPYSWFVPFIIYCYLVFYFSYRYLDAPWRSIAIVIGTILWMTVTMVGGYDRCWWISSLAFPAGIFFSEFSTPVFQFCERRFLNYCCILLLSLLLFLVLYLPRNPFLWSLCYVIIPFIVVLLVAKLPMERMRGPIGLFLASISYEIYLCQGISMEFLECKIPIRNSIVYIILVYLMTIFLAFVINRLNNAIRKRCIVQSR